MQINNYTHCQPLFNSPGAQRAWEKHRTMMDTQRIEYEMEKYKDVKKASRKCRGCGGRFLLSGLWYYFAARSNGGSFQKMYYCIECAKEQPNKNWMPGEY